MAVWFTADTHFGHANIIRYCKRPQFQCGDEVLSDDGTLQWVNDRVRDERLKEHDEFLISNWNNYVKAGDVVYHAGDFGFGKSLEELLHYFERLNGSIHLIYGNHDRVKLMNGIPFAWQGERKSIVVQKQRIIIDHYAGKVWDGSHSGSWQLFGHSHGNLEDDSTLLSLDIGVDCHNYHPVSFEEIQNCMSKKKRVI